MRLFISYSRHDLPFVKNLYSDLLDRGVRPWLDLVDIPIASDWSEEISRAIDNTDVFLLIASPWSINSKIAQNEWLRAYRQKKKILLLVIQSIPGELFLHALNSIPALDFQHEQDFSRLDWLDVRMQPLQAASMLQEWLDGSLKSQSGPLPAPPARKAMFTDKIPAKVRWDVNRRFYGGIAGIILLLLSIFTILYQQFNSSNLSYLSASAKAIFLTDIRIFGFGNLFFCAVLIYFLANRQVYGAWLTYKRLLSGSISHLLAVAFFMPMVMLIQVVFYYFSRSTINDPLIGSILVAGGLGAVAYLFFVDYLLLRQDKEFLEWEPDYDGNPVSPLGAISLSKRLLEERYPLPWIKLKGRPEHISLLYAQEDAPFARYLKKSLEKAGFSIQTDVLGTNSSSVLICILSPFFIQSDRNLDLLRQASSAGIALLPVLFQDIVPPQEIINLNWVDAQSDFGFAGKEIIAFLNGSPIPPKDTNKIKSPQRSTQPDRIMPYFMSLVFLSLINLYSSILFTLALLNGNSSFPEFLNTILVFILAAIFLLLLIFSVQRRISFTMAISITAIVSAISLPYQFSVWRLVANLLSLPAIPTFVVFYLVILGCLLFSSARIWLPGGWYLKPAAATKAGSVLDKLE